MVGFMMFYDGVYIHVFFFSYKGFSFMMFFRRS